MARIVCRGESGRLGLGTAARDRSVGEKPVFESGDGFEAKRGLGLNAGKKGGL